MLITHAHPDHLGGLSVWLKNLEIPVYSLASVDRLLRAIEEPKRAQWQPIFKNESARAMLKILKEAGTIGILADQNTMPEEGAFVDFFGTSACTTTGIARVALHTGAAVVPGYAVWDESLKKYRLRFEPPLELVKTGNAERDVVENTQQFAKVIEGIVRKYPEQWVWAHARWKTRPKGEAALYPFL